MNFNRNNKPNGMTVVLGSTLIALCFLVIGCTKTELDENERALVAKQELADRFDKLFYEGFENPDETERNLRNFVLSDLVSGDKNLLTDQDIRVNESMIKMAIRLKRIQNSMEAELNKGAIYDGYIRKNSIIINCKSVLHELPYRARKGKKYEYLQTKVAEMERQVKEIMKKRESKLGPLPAELLNKQWKWKVDIDRDVMDMADLYSDAYKKLKDFSFDFHFNKNNSITAKRFFLAPIIVDYSSSFDSAGDWKQELMAEDNISCYTYGHKICFRVPMIDNADFFTGRGNVAHEWYYEYTYSVKDNKLVLSQPRISLYVMVNQRSTDYWSDEFKFAYYEGFKSFTLTAQPL